jgi:hypothetical protein
MLPARKTWLALVVVTLAAGWTPPTSGAPLLGIKGGGEDADRWLSPNPEVVMTINVKQMVGSAIVKANLPMLKDQIKNNESLKALLDATGVDLFKDIDSVLISGSGSAKDAKALVVVKGTFDTMKIHTALKKEAESKKEIELLVEDGKQLYAIKAKDQTMYAGFASKSILVLTESREATVHAIKNGGKKVSPISKEMKEALNSFTGKESLTLAMVVNDELKKLLEKAPAVGKAAGKLQTLTASLTITDTLALNVTGNASEAKAAEQLSRGLAAVKATAGVALDELPAIVGKVVDAIAIKALKSSVIISLKVTKEMIDEAAKLGGGGN